MLTEFHPKLEKLSKCPAKAVKRYEKLLNQVSNLTVVKVRRRSKMLQFISIHVS